MVECKTECGEDAQEPVMLSRGNAAEEVRKRGGVAHVDGDGMPVH